MQVRGLAGSSRAPVLQAFRMQRNHVQQGKCSVAADPGGSKGVCGFGGWSQGWFRMDWHARRQLLGSCSPGLAAGSTEGAPGRSLPGLYSRWLEQASRCAGHPFAGPRGLPCQARVMLWWLAADFRECWLEVGGRRVLRFASAYGFRNIQGLMRKIKLGKCEYDYVEVMACPAGKPPQFPGPLLLLDTVCAPGFHANSMA